MISEMRKGVSCMIKYKKPRLKFCCRHKELGVDDTKNGTRYLDLVRFNKQNLCFLNA